MALKYSFLKTILAVSLMLCYASAQDEGTTTPEISGCQSVTCPANQECRLVNVQCFRAPCYPQPMCLDTTPACDPDPCVGLVCLYGRAKNESGCVMCGCNEPCHGVACSDGYNCEVRQDPTTRIYFGECVPTVTRRPCALFKCSANCSIGYKLDNDGCQMGCQCYDPCETYPCPENKRCVMTANDCPEGGECRDPPMPYCADISDLSSTSSSPGDRNTPVCYPEYCTLNCSNGKVKDDNGCERCECRVCGPDPCLGMVCLHGKAKDQDGCILCGCYEPCFGVICPEGQECQTPLNATTDKPVGQCVLTVTRKPCEKVTCGPVQCPYGFLSDRNGCRTCDCRDPCLGHQCPADQRCVVSGDDCPVGAECRDAPMPYCVDSSTTTATMTMNGQSSTTNGRGERGDEGDNERTLRQCCSSAGMSDSCLAVCSPNITLLYPNLETLSGCFQYLGAFLHCAAGGRSYMNCCNQRGISESCLYLCTGNDTIDLSNPHAVTQCIVSSSQTVLGCFNEGLNDANMTVSSTSTPSSTTAEDICNLPPATGNCRGSFLKWYYSAKDRACATFTYGGCGGNGNSFETKEDCLAKCSRSGSVCPDVQCNSSCQITVDDYGCHTCSCGNDCRDKGCPLGQACHMLPGSCPLNGTNCPLVPVCIGGPDIICDGMTNCTLSCPRGWMTGSNGCPICQCKAPPPSCAPACAGMVCLYGRVKGSDGCDTCDCFYPCQTTSCPDQCREMRNNATGIYYGECYSATTRPSTSAGTRPPKLSLCLVAPDYGLSCQSNSTRWFYNQSANACSSFTFGGCQGNDNNFQSKPVCEALCKDSSCPDQDCRIIQPYCPFGLKTDDSGCSICQCLDPCEGMECLGNTVCVSRKSDCADSGDACRDPFTRMCVDPNTPLSSTTAVPPPSQSTVLPTTGCPPTCEMYCILGFEKDANGCDICKCRDPCNNCTVDQTCVRMAIDCPTNDRRCANAYIGYCVEKPSTTSSPTPTSAAAAAVTSSPMPSSTIAPPHCLLCMMFCPYEMMKGANGCPVCHCYNPCESVTCMANNICQVFQNNCSTDADCPPNIRYRGQCVDTTIQTSTTTPSISSRPSTTGPIGCPHRQACSNNCPYGNGKDSNGCYTCDCDDPCLRVTCNATQTCAREAGPGYCEGDMCWASYNAVCRPKCTREVSCERMNCSYGLEKGSDGCDICRCFDPCKDVICATNEECAVTMGLSPAGYCTVRCPPMNDCAISCEFGYVKDSAGCKMCQCYDPCQSNSCAEGETCVPDKVPIYTGFVPERIYLSRCTVCQETMTCKMPCRYGYAKNMATECEMCRCYEPCQNVTCPSGQMCNAKYQFNGRYLYVAECADNTTSTTPVATKPVTSGPSTTEGIPCEPVCMIYCPYGNVKDANGCKTCRCNADPCADVVCRVNQKCVASPSENGSFYGQCIECPLPMCMSPCFFGTKIDPISGCPSCECRMDPCAAVRCRDAMCETLLLCPDDTGCTPKPVCVDPIRPCDGLQKEYEKLFGNNVANLPQLNCDSRGLFQPIQCSEYDCWCVDEYGNPMTNRSSMQLNCYPGAQTKETLRIEADINVIEEGDGWQFKQQVSQQLSNLLGIDESLVTIRKYVKGSIIADVVIGSDTNTDMTSVQRKLNLAKQAPFDVTYNNETYKAILLGGPAAPTTMAAGGGGGGDPNILMIILVCVLVPIGFVAIAVTIWFVCKICKHQRMIPPRRLSEKSSAAPTEIDSLESGSDKSYPSDKFSPEITKEEKVTPIDTTEA